MTLLKHGIQFEIKLQKGKEEQATSLPFSQQEITEYYRLKGFSQYVAWEELYDRGCITDQVLPYSEFYKLLENAEDAEILQQLNLPIQPENVSGKLILDSLPDQAEMNVELYDQSGRNLSRMSKDAGAIHDVQGDWILLPQNVWALKTALEETYDSGYQKIGICQQLAIEAGIQFDSFLENEYYHVMDSYEVDVKVHNPEHLELTLQGKNEEETTSLNRSSEVTSFQKGMERDRYVKSNEVNEDTNKLLQKQHIVGEEVPLLLENPSAILPEHDYIFDLELFSERVKGLIPIQHVKKYKTEDGKFEWFSESDDNIEMPDLDYLKDLINKHPDEQYVFDKDKWVYLDPQLRNEVLGRNSDKNESQKPYQLDIQKNEEELEYHTEGKGKATFQHFSLPESFYADLFEHQKEGFDWMCYLYEKGSGGLLADDMGLGKTIQVLAFLQRQKEKNRISPTLIVLPLALIENWVKEMKSFAPELKELVYIHQGSNRISTTDGLQKVSIILTTYDTLRIDQIIFAQVDFKHVLCDEAQNVKSHQSQRSIALRALKTNFRLALTGTPVENSLEELWAIMDFVQPGELGSLKQFRETFMDQEKGDRLLELIQPYYLRRTKKEILDNRLPKKYDQQGPIYVNASETQQNLVRPMLSAKEGGQVGVLNMLMKLRQLYGHPGAVNDTLMEISHEEAPKLLEVIRLLKNIKEKDEKVLIFTEFKKIHSILKKEIMKTFGISAPIIDGSTKNRTAVVNHFNECDGFGVMILSPKAAGVGLTITSANHVIHYTRWWNPAVENQATDRCYRIGQSKDVYVYYVITQDKKLFPNGTVEEIMHQMLEEKRDMADNVIQPFDTTGLQAMVAEKINFST